jgi:hypothetical protein
MIWPVGAILGVLPQESGWEVSGDAPSFYMRYAYAMQESWTEDADSGDREQSVHSIMNTDSGDHEHLFAPA